MTTVYLCEACALRSSFVRRDDPRSVSARTVSKATTAALIRDVETQHLDAIRSIREIYSAEDSLDVNGEPTHSAYNQDTARRLYANYLPHFTRKELTRWAAILEEVAPLRGPYTLVNARQRARTARRRWTRFCEFWPLLALQIFTDRVTQPAPKTKPKRRLGKEMLVRIEDMERQ